MISAARSTARVISASSFRVAGDVNFQARPLPEFSALSRANLSFVRDFPDSRGNKFDFTLMPRGVSAMV